MNQIFVRPMRDDADLKKLLSWAVNNPAWDSNVLRFRNSFTLCAFNSTGTLAFMPVQQVPMMEAIAFHPLATDSQKASAMKEFTKVLVYYTAVSGNGEIFFLGSNECTNKFAEHQGFQRVDLPTYRMRLRDLEVGGGDGSTT